MLNILIGQLMVIICQDGYGMAERQYYSNESIIFLEASPLPYGFLPDHIGDSFAQ